MYLTYEEFYDFGGGDVSEADFPRLSYRACKFLDLHTHSRVKAMAQVPEAVKRALVELIMIDSNSAATLSNQQSVKSYSTDGYSETMSDGLSASEVDALKNNVLLEFLGEETDDNGTPLMYAGVDA